VVFVCGGSLNHIAHIVVSLNTDDVVATGNSSIFVLLIIDLLSMMLVEPWFVTFDSDNAANFQ